MSRILAIDYGMKRCGVALSDPLKIAVGESFFCTTNLLEEKLRDYCKRYAIEKIVLGYPKNLDNTDNEMTEVVRRFCRYLEKSYADKEVILLDERLSSKMAVKTLVQLGVHLKKRRLKGNIDKVSAAILLRDYLLLT